MIVDESENEELFNLEGDLDLVEIMYDEFYWDLE